ncbi:hypothetical protein EEB15_02335 [Ramlibacter sp. WS9]|nr:hypothetical protein EEB15_02335 [Ramlibacter sp. WS9]
MVETSTLRLNRPAILSLALLAAIAVQGCGGSGSEANAVPGPPAAALTEVKVAGTTPMSATPVDLAAAGYVAREFYAEGKANRYAGVGGGAPGFAGGASLQTATVLDGGWAYRTRVMVRTPAREKFNGTLVVEWTNVTVGADFEFANAEASKYLLREGYAVAVVSAQRVGVERLKTWSPTRYAGLSVDVNACGADGTPATTGTSLCAGDPLSFDIFTQVTQALKQNAGGSSAPMPGLVVEDVIAIGQSQSAFRLQSYYNSIQPLAGVINGFAYWDMSNQLRSDQRVPAISVQSEAFAVLIGQWTTSEFTRRWDVAGSTHASLYGSQYIDAIVARDQSIIGPAGPISFTQWVQPTCTTLPPFTTVDVGLVFSNAIDAVRRWVRTGAPAAPSINFERDASGALVRDADGRVLGGIRLAQFTAPIAEQKAPNGTAFPCSISGWHRDYTPSELKSIYGDHGNYVAQVTNAMVKAATDGYILAADAVAAIRDAENSDVAK